MNNSENSGSTADRYQVVVHVPAGTSASSPHLENGPHVTAVGVLSGHTPAAKWYAGEQIDWEHAVSLLFN